MKTTSNSVVNEIINMTTQFWCLWLMILQEMDYKNTVSAYGNLLQSYDVYQENQNVGGFRTMNNIQGGL